MVQLYTKSQIQQMANQYVLANSPLTDVREGSTLNAISGALAYVVAMFYRDMRINFVESAIQGAFQAFNFNALPGTAASTTLQGTVSQATTVPVGAMFSTVGNANQPAVVFQCTQTVSSTGAGTVSIPVQAVNVGSAGNVPANTITNIITAIPGLVAVTNPQAASGGTDPETLSQQLARFQTYLQSLPGATTQAIAYAASQVAGVTKAQAFAPQYLYGLQSVSGSITDYSVETNSPKGTVFSPFASSPSVGDAFYIGAQGPFSGFYIDVATNGSGINATWQYYGANGWTNLTTTQDLTNNGQQSGSVSFNVPQDWTVTTINGYQAYWIRLVLNSTSYTTMPLWYSVFTNDPPPGYINLFVDLAASAPSNTLQNIQQAVNAIRAAGDTVVINQCTQQPVNITMNVIPTSAGASQPLSTLIANSLTQLINGLAIGQKLPLSEITYAVTSLGNGTYVAEVTVQSPTTDIVVAPSVLLVPGTFNITIGAVQWA